MDCDLIKVPPDMRRFILLNDQGLLLWVCVGGNLTFCRTCYFEYGRQDHAFLTVYAKSLEATRLDVDDAAEGVDIVWVGVYNYNSEFQF